MEQVPTSKSGTPAGWYPDPAGSGGSRWWDGSRWTDAAAPGHAHPPAPPGTGQDASRTWALAAHLSALLSLVIGLPFVGPLVVYLARRDDPYVRYHAAEALNFNISVTIYGIALGLVTLFLIFVLIGLLLIPVVIALAIAWFVLVVIATIKASNGEHYRYPLTIRFVS